MCRLHLEKGSHLTCPALAPNGPAWHPEHLHLLSLQLVVQARHSVPMMLFLDSQFVLLPFCTLSTVTIHRCLSCLLPRYWCDSPEMCQPGWEYSLRDNFLHLAPPGVYQNFSRISCEIFIFLGTGRSSTGTNGGSSRLTRGCPRRALDIVQII